MPKYQLEVCMQLQGLEKVTIDSPTSFQWRLKLKCSNCGFENPKQIFISEEEQVEKLVKSGTGTTNLNYTCSECKRHSTVDIIPGTFKEYTTSEKWMPLIQFDTRGVDLMKWEPEGKEGLIGISNEETNFEIDLENGEYYDYDEESGQEVSITNIETRFTKVKEK
ncbi:hypothetical protein ABK040_009075 [Willaertia magna]